MTTRSGIIIAITLVYFLVIIGTGFVVRRHANTSQNFSSGGGHFSPLLIAALLLSEYIGTSVSIGTAQKAFESGISAAWSLVALALGFLLLGLLLVRKYRETGLNTISAILETTYGSGVRYAASLLTIFSLNIVCVALYASGGAVLAAVMHINTTLAIIILGLVATFFVAIGGFRSVVYTNTLNTVIKYAGIILALAFVLDKSGGLSHLRASVPPKMFDPSAVGAGQIFAWIIAGVGSIFATQYVIQGLVSAKTNEGARRGCFYVAVLMVPFGLIVATIGVASSLLYPGTPSISAFPEVIAHMPTFTASIVVVGLAGALFGGISATAISSATLLLKDFYQPLMGARRSGAGSASSSPVDDEKALRFIRIATIVIGLCPMVLALFASKVLLIAFLGKSLRATLAVLILFSFFAPKFGTARGALIGVILSIIGTIGWFAAQNPFGIDSSYLALGIPVAVMAISHIGKLMGPMEKETKGAALPRSLSKPGMHGQRGPSSHHS